MATTNSPNKKSSLIQITIPAEQDSIAGEPFKKPGIAQATIFVNLAKAFFFPCLAEAGKVSKDSFELFFAALMKGTSSEKVVITFKIIARGKEFITHDDMTTFLMLLIFPAQTTIDETNLNIISMSDTAIKTARSALSDLTVEILDKEKRQQLDNHARTLR
eukprot:TRINITY_DN783_c0_g2_i2.p1 TRINITY_DN783_c0_g2~~TRINITY_DN783_c0_g2_i2.p1  ORF type:complete len:181 (-),score=30.59 TRINITY_DN783_c0_g2_i2:26-508(-)